MPYEILPHTADVGVGARASDLPRLFSEAARGTAVVLLDRDPPAPTGAASVAVTAEDLPALLAAFLEECLYLYEVRDELVVGAQLEVTETSARGEALTVRDARGEGPQIKAVTYHDLRVEREDGGWSAQVYFDV